MIILKFVFNINFELFQKIHNNFNEKNCEKIVNQIFDNIKVNQCVYEFFIMLLNYEEKYFSDFECNQ